jgi:hypothetical protein
LLGNPGHANGFAAVIWPIAFTYVYAKAVVDLAATLLRTGTLASFHDRMIELMTLIDLVGLSAICEKEAQYCGHLEHVHIKRTCIFASHASIASA